MVVSNDAGGTVGTDVPGGSPSGPSGKGRIIAAAVVVLAVAVGIAVTRMAPAPSPPGVSVVGDPASDHPIIGAGRGKLLALLQTGQRSKYHAVYQVVGDPAKIGGSQRLEIWNAPPRQRSDSTRTAGGHVYRSETLTEATSTSLCTQLDNAAWSCQPVTGSAGGADSLATSLETSVQAATNGQSVVVTSKTVSGRKASCFTIGNPRTGLQICITADGVPVLISNPVLSYQLTTLDGKIPGSTFKLPG